MVEVGIKELKDGLSAYLRRVARGEHPELLQLEAEGKITLSRLPKPRRSPPPSKSRRSASRYILDERESER